MISVIQEVNEASVKVDGEMRGRISSGWVVLVGVEKGDGEGAIKETAERLYELKRERECEDGEFLLISQFTLAANCRKGRRPSFSHAARPETAEPMYERVVEELRRRGCKVETGVFGALMSVEINNVRGGAFIMNVNERQEG